MNPTQAAAHQRLQALINEYNQLSAQDRHLTNESNVVHHFISPLLQEVLGWPNDINHYLYELNTTVGRPDITFIADNDLKIFVECKRFGIIKDSPIRPTSENIRVMGPQQMTFSTMTVDRSREEQQAINYAFENGGTWAILTNFEKFRLFNARRDTLVLNIETPGGYLEGFDLLWRLHYSNILNGSLDELSKMRPAPEVDEDYLRFINIWRERLAQDLVARTHHNTWVRHPDGSLNLTDLRNVVQRYIDRLVIIRYAEAHLVVPPGMLQDLYELGQRNRYMSVDNTLSDIFRGFDRDHNSALFAPGLVDDVTFSDKVVLELIGDLYKARYRAMPPDIIGNTYEQYLGKTLVQANGSVKTADNLETRKKQGSYYTPQVIVQYIVDSTLGRYLYGTTNGKPNGDPLPHETRKTSRDIQHLRVLDSACGSGGFLIYAYQVLAEFYQREMERLQQAAHARMDELAAQGITDPNTLRIETLQFFHERDRITDYRRLILETHLYGVDLDPQAAEIAVVNLMMRAMEGLHSAKSEDKRLPLLLNQNVKVGNSLIGTVYPSSYPHPLTPLPNHPHPLTPSPFHGEGEQDHLPSPRTGEGEFDADLLPSPRSGEGPGVGMPSDSSGVGMPLHSRTSAELWDKIKPLARQMRHDPTLAEERLWKELRGKRLGDFKFRRQHPIDRFIVDFYCHDARLIVELDGPIHDYTPEQDAARQEFLESLGLRVLRFKNDDVLSEMPGVLERIYEELQSPRVSPPPTPPHFMERGVENRDITPPRYAVERGLGGEDVLAHLYALRQAVISTPHTSPEHDHAIRDLQAATAAAQADLNAALAPHFTDLEAVNPFHWAIEFPEVFVDAHGHPLDNPGFTIILGNPPWEILKPDLREFYAQFDAHIESHYTREKVEKRIAELNALDPNIPAAYTAQKQRIEATAAYFRQSPDYTRQGRGDTATHKLFLERSYALLNDGGRLGYVVPSGIYTDLGTKGLREMLLNEGRIEYIFSFSNERFFFPGVDHRFKFALLGAQKGQLPSLRSGEGLGVGMDGFWAAFRFNPRVAIAPDELADFLADESNLIFVRRESLERFSPDSLSLMEFQTRQDYELAEKVYGDWPLLGMEIEDSWNLHLTSEFHMTNDRHLFRSSPTEFPLYEGKMIHQFDAFYSEPQYWIDGPEGRKSIFGRNADDNQVLGYEKYRLAVRAIARSTDQRTLITTVLPANSFAGNSLLVDKGISDERTTLYLCGVMNSLCVDHILKLKVAANVNMFYIYQLPVPRLQSGHPTFDAIVRRAAQLTCTRPEFAALWESVMGTAWQLSSPPPAPPHFMERGVENQGITPPRYVVERGLGGEDVLPVTDSAARQQLRDEIDALVAHLYGLSAAELEHILGTFPLVFPNTPEGDAKKAKLLATFAAL